MRATLTRGSRSAADVPSRKGTAQPPFLWRNGNFADRAVQLMV